ncbi:hypothetical protein BH23BAC4_BH23BAC4_05970 [soil metagenome]
MYAQNAPVLASQGYQPPPPTRVRPKPFGDRYLLFLCLGLLGYAVLNRGFAYWGVAPLFIGEILLVAGLIAFLGSGRLGAVAREPVMVLYGLLLAWSVVRLVPYLGIYQLDAPRDFMVVGYGLFAPIVAGLLLARPARLREILLRYQRYVGWMVVVFPVVYLAFKLLEPQLPRMPAGADVPIFEAKGGDMMVQLAGITAFVILGMRRRTTLLLGSLAVVAGMVMVSNRGGMVAYLLAGAVVLALRPPQAQLGKLAWIFVMLFALGLLVGPLIEVQSGTGTRAISAEQVVENVRSIVGESDEWALGATTSWRLVCWERIVNYTFNGPHFWTGRGFGVNLAESDGIIADKSVRSPHNGHLTILARTGVPGFGLWILLQLTWLGYVGAAWLRARRAQQWEWTAVLAFVIAYWTAAHANASFDIYFEGPMGAIWFWTFFGAGLAAARLQQTDPDCLSDEAAHIGNGGRGAAQGVAGPQPVPEPGWRGPSLRNGGPDAGGARPPGDQVRTPQRPSEGDGAAGTGAPNLLEPNLIRRNPPPGRRS